MTTLLGISGSLRAASTNTMLMHNAADIFAADTFVQANIRLPLYDGDIEESTGIPADVQTLADQIADADAVIIAGPEYNKSISGSLKNALDWVSRTEGNPWADKPVAIMSAGATLVASARARGERWTGPLIGRQTFTWTMRAPDFSRRSNSSEPSTSRARCGPLFAV